MVSPFMKTHLYDRKVGSNKELCLRGGYESVMNYTLVIFTVGGAVRTDDFSLHHFTFVESSNRSNDRRRLCKAKAAD